MKYFQPHQPFIEEYPLKNGPKSCFIVNHVWNLKLCKLRTFMPCPRLLKGKMQTTFQDLSVEHSFHCQAGIIKQVMLVFKLRIRKETYSTQAITGSRPNEGFKSELNSLQKWCDENYHVSQNLFSDFYNTHQTFEALGVMLP